MIRLVQTAAGVATRALKLNPMRTLLSTLGVVVGVAALVAVLSVGDGVARFAREQIATSTDLQAVLVVPQTSRLVDHQRVPRTDYPVFAPGDAASLAAGLPAGSFATVMTSGSAALADTGGAVRGILVQATDAGFPNLSGLALANGRYFTPAEARAGAAVTLVSSNLAAQEQYTPGDTIVLGGDTLAVLGIVKGSPDDAFLRAWIPLSRAGRVLRDAPPPNLVVKAASVEAVPTTIAAVERWLTTRYGDWHGRAAVRSNRQRVAQARQGILIFKILMGAVTGISLLVGGIGIMNVLLAAVAERTREIGVRRAAGASRADILIQFLVEAVTVTGAGSVIGVALGLAGAYGVTALMRARTEALVYAATTWSTIVVAVAAGVAVGVVFGLYPGIRAARLPPIEALRYE